MADQPADGVELTDEELDEIVRADDDDETPSTGTPAAALADSTDDDSADTPADAPTVTAPAGDVDTAPATAAQPDSSASAPAVPAGKPFQFKATGSDHTLPWAHELPDGSVVIPKESQAELRRELASGRELQANFKQLQRNHARELNTVKTARTAKDAESEAVIAWGAELARKTPEELFSYLTELQGNTPTYQLELEKRKLEEQRKLFEEQKRGPQLSDEEQREQITETITGELETTFQWIDQQPQFQALTPQEKQAVKARWLKKPALLVRRAVEDDPANGIAKGDQVFDPTDVLEDIAFLAANKKVTALSSTAAARNASLNADKAVPVNRIPPSVRSTPPVGQPRNKDGQFAKGDEGRKQFRADFMKDDDDEAA